MESTKTLIVESNPERRDRLAHLLKESGFEVSVAADMAAAILTMLRGGERNGEAGKKPTLAELEKRYAREVLDATGGNKTRAAEILGIDRKTLYRLIGATPAQRAAAAAAANGQPNGTPPSA
jgi:DNA-binding NtrC family response regulator